jgi:hypothetical protein
VFNELPTSFGQNTKELRREQEFHQHMTQKMESVPGILGGLVFWFKDGSKAADILDLWLGSHHFI